MSDKLYVQAGKSVTSKRGLLAEGTEVSEKDFSGGAKSIKGLGEKKIIGPDKPDLRPKAEIVAEREEKKKTANTGGAEKKLDKMTVEELKAYAAEKEIEIPEDVTLKADILTTIELAEEESGE